MPAVTTVIAVIGAAAAVGGAVTGGVQASHQKKTSDNAARGQEAKQQKALADAQAKEKEEKLLLRRSKDRDEARARQKQGQVDALGRQGTILAGGNPSAGGNAGSASAGKTLLGT